MGVRWVFTEKETGLKARFVVQGFSDKRQAIDAMTPTLSVDAFRSLMFVRAGQPLVVGDVLKAYLHSDTHDDDMPILIHPPKLADGTHATDSNGQVQDPKQVWWKLVKAVYGRIDAGSLWRTTFISELHKLGFVEADFDPCVFLLFSGKDHKIDAIVAFHVDDVLCWGTAIVDKLESMDVTFGRIVTLKTIGSSVIFSGLRITMTESGYLVDVNRTIQKLQPVWTRTVKTPLVEEDTRHVEEQQVPLEKDMITHYRSMVGSATWIAQQVAPGIAYATNFLARQITSLTEQDLVTADKLHKFLVDHPPQLTFQRIQPSGVFLVGWCDAAWAARRDDYASITGYLIQGMEQDPQTIDFDKPQMENFLSWKCHVQPKVCRSSMAAELNATVDCGLHLLFMAHVMAHLQIKLRGMFLMTDSRNAIAITASKHFRLPKDKSLVLPARQLREVLQQGVQLLKCPGKGNLADALTKARPMGPSLFVE